MATTYTLAEFAKMYDDAPLKKGVINVLRKESIMEYLPFASHKKLAIELYRTTTNPEGATRSIGEAFPAMTLAEMEPVREQPCFLGAKIDIPKEYVEAEGQIVNARVFQTDAGVRGMAYKFNDMFLNGVPGAKDMVGLRYRILNDLPSSQHINANGLDVSPDSAALAASQIKLIDYVDEAIDACDGHTCDLIIANRYFYRRLKAALRDNGMFATTRDVFDRQIMTYGENGPKIIDAGYKADQTTQIIGDAENDAGTAFTGGDTTSAYFIKTGGEQYLNAWQFQELDAVDKGLLEDHVSYRTIIDWAVGLYFVNPRSISRLSGVVAK